MTDYSRDHEWRTLADHDVQPGDEVIIFCGRGSTVYTVGRGEKPYPSASVWACRGEVCIGPKAIVRVKSRAPQPAPMPDTTNPDRKPWLDMTDAEKGALLLAKHRGKVIEVLERVSWVANPVAFHDQFVYRTRPEPKRETRTLYIYANERDYALTALGTIELEDGKPVPGSGRYNAPT